ncbi:High mobility group protein 2 [Quillaja saponaria]|uniref:High mobility group protein 2 n=1 Tax=Quillaja saponaria TaxID=32244 RepID=A0AAD7L7U9_QUISA|nr:High mobility group protein 2 [Quillaja saponaria]
MTGARSKAEPKKTNNKLKPKSAGAGKKPAKKEKLAKDPNKPKRPPKAEFREQFKKDHPNNKSVSVVGKAAGEKWKSMSAADKAPYQAKADKKKKDYDKDVQAYDKRLAEGKNASEEEESDKSKSEINDEEDEEDESGEEEEDDD